MQCLLCQSSQLNSLRVIRKPERDYFHCQKCDYIFMNPALRLDAAEEKARYDLHQNQETAGYTSFFAPLINEVVNYFRSANIEPTQLTCLDYGCGPTAVLSKLLEAEGIKTENFDAFYFPGKAPLQKTYHLVTSTEVWEHLYDPQHDIETMLSLLKPGGLLAVMTSLHKGEAAFHDWHYRRDMTHVGFFSEQTMKYLCERHRLHIIKMKSPYFIFQKMFS